MIAWAQRYAILLLGLGIALTLAALLQRQFALLQERSAHAQDIAAIERERTEASELARTWQAAMFRAYEVAKRTADEQIAAIDVQDALISLQQSRIHELSVDVSGLRADLRDYAAGSAGTDTLAACQSRANNLADQLAEGAGLVIRAGNLAKRLATVAREAAVAEAKRAVEVNECVSAWPSAP